MGFSARGGDEGSGLRTVGLRDRGGTINIFGRVFLFSLFSIGYGLAALFVLVHKIMNCRFPSYTYCTL